MGDLTEALMVLTREATGRRQARRQLREAVTTIGTAMLNAGLRAGDHVILQPPEVDGTKGGLYQVVSVTWPVSQRANGVRDFLCPDHKNTLVLGNEAVLVDVRDNYHDGHNLHRPVGRSLLDADIVRAEVPPDPEEPNPYELRLATDEELVQFCKEAVAVTTKFAKLLADQGRTFTAVAQAVTKLVPS